MNIHDNKFEQTDQKLRLLIDRLFATNELFTFEDLIHELTDCFKIDVCFLIYIREKAWFSSGKNTQSGFLKFNFLSFQLRKGVPSRFETQRHLSAAETELEGDHFKQRSSDLCKILYRYAGDEDLDRILNLLMRIFVAFYKNCGSHDHFRDSVATRFVKDFFRGNPSATTSDVVDYIKHMTSLDVSIWRPADEMFFRENSKRETSTLLRDFPSLDTQLPPFAHDPNFREDLNTSVIRKNQTFGQTTDGLQHYVVKTFSANHFANMDDAPWSSFKERQKAVAVFSALDEQSPIILDAVFHASALIKSYLGAVDDLKFSDVLLNADERCIDIEAEISESPLASKTEIARAINTTLEPTFKDVAEITQADSITFWLLDPFKNSLAAKLSIGAEKCGPTDQTEQQLDLAQDRDHVAVLSYLRDKTYSLSHPLWIHSELQQQKALTASVPDDRSKKMERLREHASRRAEYRNSGSNQQCSCIVVPVSRSGILVGVLEICSAAVGQMTFDAKLFERLSRICGDVMRRVELANDRAWLTRMSFIHASRHRLEELFRDIETKAGEAGRGFVRALRAAQHGLDADGIEGHGAHQKISSMDRITAALTKHGANEEVQAWLTKFNKIQQKCGFGSETLNIVVDILETLSANSIHSNFLIEFLECSFVDEDQDGKFSLMIKYEPEDLWVSGKKMDQIGHAPIPSPSGLTFHYGLFLLGSQVRMLGGIVETKENMDDIGNNEFGLAFRVPAL